MDISTDILPTGATVALFVVAGAVGWLQSTLLVAHRRLLGLCAWPVCSAWTLTVTFHLLRPLGLFSTAPAFCTLTAAALALGYVRRANLPQALRREGRFLFRTLRLLRTSPHRRTVGFFVSVAALVAARTLVVPPIAWDTLTYHGLRPALWIQSGQATLDLAPGPWEIYQHYFAGAEVLAAWAMLPLKTDTLVGVTQALQWVAAMVAITAFGRALGLREPVSSSAAVFVAFVPTMLLAVGSGYTEPINMLLWTTSLASVVLSIQTPRIGLVLLTAGTAGLLLGTKVSNGPQVGIVTLTLLWSIWRCGTRSVHERLVLSLASLLLLIVPSLPWVLLSLTDTGYPLSPLPLSIAGVQLGTSNPSFEWYLTRPELHPMTIRTEIDTLRQIFANPFTAGEGLDWWMLVPLAVFPWAWATLRRRSHAAAVLVLGVVVAVVAFFYSSGFSVVRMSLPVTTARFLLPLAAVAVPVSSLLYRRRDQASEYCRRSMLFACAVTTLVNIPRGGLVGDIQAILSVVLGAALSSTLIEAARQRAGRVAAIATATVAATTLLAVLQIHSDAQWAKVPERAFWIHPVMNYWAEAAAAVDEPGHTHTIALTSGPLQVADNWLAARFLGRRLQNRLTYVSAAIDGGARAFDGTAPPVRAADESLWLARLRAKGVTEVFSFWPRSLELNWMERDTDHFRPISTGPTWGLYQFRP